MSTAALRPLSLGELLDRTFFLYRRHFLLFVSIIAIPHLVLTAFQFIGVAINPRGVGFTTASILWTFATFVVYLPVIAASHGTTVIAVSKLHLGQETTIAESFSGVAGRTAWLSWVLLVAGVVLGFALVFGVIIGGVFLWLGWSLIIPIAVLEDAGLADTLTRSWQLTRGSRGRIFVIGFLFVVLTYMVYILWEFPILAMLGLFARNYNLAAGLPKWFLIAAPVGTLFTQCLVGPLLTIALALTYYDQKIRKEAFDLQLMMSNLDAAQSAAPTPPAGM
jgi:hypothetical protein